MISGFGINVNWDWDKSQIPKGHTMPFIQLLATAMQEQSIIAAVPGWLLSLMKRGREALRVHNTLEVGNLSTFH